MFNLFQIYRNHKLYLQILKDSEELLDDYNRRFKAHSKMLQDKNSSDYSYHETACASYSNSMLTIGVLLKYNKPYLKFKNSASYLKHLHFSR